MIGGRRQTKTSLVARNLSAARQKFSTLLGSPSCAVTFHVS
jgi:hypothetical protein